jgi:hypothetical protein
MNELQKKLARRRELNGEQQGSNNSNTTGVVENDEPKRNISPHKIFGKNTSPLKLPSQLNEKTSPIIKPNELPGKDEHKPGKLSATGININVAALAPSAITSFLKSKSKPVEVETDKPKKEDQDEKPPSPPPKPAKPGKISSTLNINVDALNPNSVHTIKAKPTFPETTETKTGELKHVSGLY